MGSPLKTSLKLLFSSNETDVTDELSKDLLSWSYVDRESGQADEISLTLKDETGKWAGSWKPDGGESVKMYLSSGPVGSAGIGLYCGKFYVDNQRVSGAPRVYTMRAVSIPLNKPVRKLSRTKAWESTTLRSIAQTITDEAGLELLFDSEDDPSYTRCDQKAESDLKFLTRLCGDAGLSVKVTDSQLVIFDQQAYETKDPVLTIQVGVSDILSYDFESSQGDTYKSVTIKWRDPTKKVKGNAAGERMYDVYGQETKTSSNPAINSYTYTDPDADENGQEFELKRRATSIEDAKRLAKAKLRQLNSRSVTGSVTLVGNPLLVAGVVIAVSGFGSFDGNLIIEEAVHSGGSSGYTTALHLRRVNSNY